MDATQQPGCEDGEEGSPPETGPKAAAAGNFGSQGRQAARRGSSGAAARAGPPERCSACQGGLRAAWGGDAAARGSPATREDGPEVGVEASSKRRHGPRMVDPCRPLHGRRTAFVRRPPPGTAREGGGVGRGWRRRARVCPSRRPEETTRGEFFFSSWTSRS